MPSNYDNFKPLKWALGINESPPRATPRTHPYNMHGFYGCIFLSRAWAKLGYRNTVPDTRYRTALYREDKIPYHTVLYITAGEGGEANITYRANTEKSINHTVPCYRYADYHLPYRLFILLIPLPRTALTFIRLACLCFPQVRKDDAAEQSQANVTCGGHTRASNCSLFTPQELYIRKN